MSRPAQPGRPGAARRTMNPAESNRLFVYEYDRGSNYEEDTRLTAALSALLPEDELVHPDQRLFQTVHLITEYAWCEMHYEMRRAARGLGGRDYLLAAQLLERAAATGDVAVRALCVLLDFLPQESLLRMRETFPENTTGLDSPGARNLRRAAAALWQETEAALAREGIGMRDVVRAQGRAASPAREDRAPDLALVRQALLRLDGAVAAWKHHHLRLVWSQLGGHPETAPARPATPTAAPTSSPTTASAVGSAAAPGASLAAAPAVGSAAAPGASPAVGSAPGSAAVPGASPAAGSAVGSAAVPGASPTAGSAPGSAAAPSPAAASALGSAAVPGVSPAAGSAVGSIGGLCTGLSADPVGGPSDGRAVDPAVDPSLGRGARDDLPKSLRGQSTAGVRAMAERSLFPRLWDSVDDTYRALVPDEQTPPA